MSETPYVPSTAQPVQLDARQERVRRRLLYYCGEAFALQYLSAIQVMQLVTIPGAHSMVAHQLRDLVDRIASLAPPREEEVGLAFGDARNLLRKLADRWLKALDVPDFKSEVDWAERCADGATQELLLEVHSIIGGATVDHRVRLALRSIAAAFNPSLVEAGEAACDEAAEALWTCRERLIKIVKRSNLEDYAELEDRVAALTLALERVFPEVIREDFDALAQRIQEVESRV